MAVNADVMCMSVCLCACLCVCVQEAPELAAWLSGLLPESTMHVGRSVWGAVT